MRIGKLLFEQDKTTQKRNRHKFGKYVFYKARNGHITRNGDYL